MDVSVKTLIGSGVVFLALLAVVAVVVYGYGRRGRPEEDNAAAKVMRVVTPLPAPKMMDLPQFQGEHKESLYWGTYRPHLYLGIRARTPRSLIAGLMWIGIKNGQYFLRHVCEHSDELSTYGWTDHNGRDYGRQLLVDHGLSLTTSFLKEKGEGSGYGGDWAVRLGAKNERSSLIEAEEGSKHLFFYIADEAGNPFSMDAHQSDRRDALRLAFGSHEDIGGWELYLKSEDNLEIHTAGFRSLHMHNLSDLVQGTLANHAMRTGLITLPDMTEDSSNIMVYQVYEE